MMQNKCPYCGAPVQQQATFCLHCMRDLTSKQEIKKQKKPFPHKKVLIIITACVLTIALGIGAFFFFYKPPITTFLEFKWAAEQANERLGCQELWEPENLKDTINLEANGERVTKYQTKMHIDGVQAAFFLTDKKDEAYFAICDVRDDTRTDSQKLIVLAAASIMNAYSDMDEIIHDDITYPFGGYATAYEEQFTDSFDRTAQYEADIKNGVKISTQVKHGYIDNKYLVMYVATTRDYGDYKLYDLAFNYEYK